MTIIVDFKIKLQKYIFVLHYPLGINIFFLVA